MRYLLACVVVLGCGAPPKPLTEIETVPTNAVEDKPPVAPKLVDGFASFKGFPIPGDAEDRGAGQGNSHVFVSMRTREVVHDELVPYLKKKGWRIKYLGEDGISKVEEKTVFMEAYRFYAATGDKVHFISLAHIEAKGNQFTGISITLEPVDDKMQPVKATDI